MAMQKMAQVIVTVTPEMAREWLKLNVANNRTIRRTDVEAYKELIKDDRWLLTPEGIQFNVNGRLIDGQHRLTAIAESGKSVQMVVWHNVPVAAMEYLNTGRTRSLADVLTVTGGVGADVSARHMVSRAAVIYDLHHPKDGLRKQTVQHYDWVKERYLEDIAWAGRNYPGGAGGNVGVLTRKVRAAPIMGALALAHKKNPEEIETFTRRLDTGLELTDNDPAYALRRYLDGGDMGGINRLQFSYAALRCAYAAVHKRKLSIIKGHFLTPTNPEFSLMLNYFGVRT